MLLPSRGATLPNNRTASCSSFILRIFFGRHSLAGYQNKKGPSPFLPGNPAFFLLSSLMKVPSSITPIFYAAIIDFWVLIISFLLTRGRGKVNKKQKRVKGIECIYCPL
jgi:hypothetical protein